VIDIIEHRTVPFGEVALVETVLCEIDSVGDEFGPERKVIENANLLRSWKYPEGWQE